MKSNAPWTVQAILILAYAGLFTGCGDGSGSKQAAADVPDPPLAKLLPPDYRAQQVLRADLTEGPVPETVVTSVGPPRGEHNMQPATIQVLSWNGLAKRWTVIFDGQKVIAPESYGHPQTSNSGPGRLAGPDYDPRPILDLDPEANVGIGQVRFAPILPGKRSQLIFSAKFNYASGYPSVLAVVDFPKARANVLYSWRGEGLWRDWKVRDNRIVARSNYWTHGDSHCCPLRTYWFTVGAKDDYVTELEDERPYLGVRVRYTGEDYQATTPLEVLEVAEESPAASTLRVGDIILDVSNSPPRKLYWPDSIIKRVSSFDAGETAELLVRRRGAEMTLRVRLGSLRDATTMTIPEDDFGDVDAL